MESKKIAITGATGFIGRRLLERCLKNHWDVRILSRHPDRFDHLKSRLEVFKGDLTDPSTNLTPFLAGCDVFFHCAGEIRDEKKMFGLHVEGTQRLIDAVDNRSLHWVHLSSVGAYGQHQRGVVDENTRLNPSSTYECTKTKSDELVMEACARAAFKLTILRPSTVYSSDMPNNSLRALISAIQKKRYFFIGPRGSQAVYVHVEDVVSALLLAAEHQKDQGRVYNVSDQISFEEFVDLVCQLSGTTPIRARLPEALVRLGSALGAWLPGFPLTKSRVDALTTRVVYDTSRITHELGFKPAVSTAKGLSEMIKSMQGVEGQQRSVFSSSFPSPH